MGARHSSVCTLGNIGGYVPCRADGAADCVHGGSFWEKPLTSGPDVQAPANRLLAALPRADRERFVASCETVELPVNQVLMRPRGRIAHAFFPTHAVLSLGVTLGRSGQWLEVALVGSEGMAGLPLLLGVAASAMRVTVLRAGGALRIDAARLQEQLLASPPLRITMERYILVVLTQMAQAALCTRYHQVDQRLARWLLMAQDRAPGEDLRATHESLAAGLGVRRAGVSRAAAGLQEHGLIAYHRGLLTLLDRAGLEAAACSCYATDLASYAALMRSRA